MRRHHRTDSEGQFQDAFSSISASVASGLPKRILPAICVTLEIHAALYKERADDGGEHGDDKLDDGLPSLQVFQNFHNR